LTSAYEKTSRQIEGLGDISKYGGSTALTCVLWKDEKTNQLRLYTANIGDSRAVLCRDGKAVALSYDHVARDPAEQERVKQKKGIIRNNMLGFCLELTRAFGDRGLLHYGLTSDPHISEAVIGPKDEFMILASDGIWDVFSNREAVDFVKKVLSDKTRSLRSCDEIARSLLTKALHRQDCNDNLSVVIVRFKPDDTEIGSASQSLSPSSSSTSSDSSVTPGFVIVSQTEQCNDY
jgi:serine/threonine protein phosphatase PrpC